MFLVVGLGNPGKRYENTWHSLGFLSIDEFQKKNNFPEFIFSQRFNSLISESVFGNKKILLAKPQTFMNESGQALKKILSFYKINKFDSGEIKTENLIVIHDDADLEKGKLRISKNRGTAGHKGLDSIVGNTKTKNFVRIRIGVRPKNYIPGSKSLEKFVIKKFANDEKEIAKEIIEKASEAIEMILEKGVEKAMAKFNA